MTSGARIATIGSFLGWILLAIRSTTVLSWPLVVRTAYIEVFWVWVAKVFSLSRVGVTWLAGSWYSPTTQKRILRTNPMPPTIATPIRMILMLSFVSCQSGFWAT